MKLITNGVDQCSSLSRPWLCLLEQGKNTRSYLVLDTSTQINRVKIQPQLSNDDLAEKFLIGGPGAMAQIGLVVASPSSYFINIIDLDAENYTGLSESIGYYDLSILAATKKSIKIKIKIINS